MGKKTHDRIGAATIEANLSPDVRLVVQGITTHIKPKNFLTKILWKFLKIEVNHKDAPNLYDIIPKINYGELYGEVPTFNFLIQDLYKKKKQRRRLK